VAFANCGLLSANICGRDFLIWQRGGSPTALSASDLADWQANYGNGSLAASVAVSEPTAWLLLIGGVLMLSNSYRLCARLSH
jgi:hypothetical protein